MILLETVDFIGKHMSISHTSTQALSNSDVWDKGFDCLFLKVTIAWRTPFSLKKSDHKPALFASLWGKNVHRPVFKPRVLRWATLITSLLWWYLIGPQMGAVGRFCIVKWLQSRLLKYQHCQELGNRKVGTTWNNKTSFSNQSASWSLNNFHVCSVFSIDEKCWARKNPGELE